MPTVLPTLSPGESAFLDPRFKVQGDGRRPLRLCPLETDLIPHSLEKLLNDGLPPGHGKYTCDKDRVEVWWRLTGPDVHSLDMYVNWQIMMPGWETAPVYIKLNTWHEVCVAYFNPGPDEALWHLPKAPNAGWFKPGQRDFFKTYCIERASGSVNGSSVTLHVSDVVRHGYEAYRGHRAHDYNTSRLTPEDTRKLDIVSDSSEGASDWDEDWDGQKGSWEDAVAGKWVRPSMRKKMAEEQAKKAEEQAKRLVEAGRSRVQYLLPYLIALAFATVGRKCQSFRGLVRDSQEPLLHA
eukprot:gnl/TRDRNA2_/TRDRNA2_34043_c0_seq1.p1 gnl/TRDRNA2_/TRDRNA2_34043_c0~~gnl/TRDRNA2_/TRDRNA2_34043_c0_seq1.p1  ORF type:complete len:295 (-),score=30.49 gnl/TRDRNA2_/TRDRNA2_34043_c0_seq1:156-1040(-)